MAELADTLGPEQRKHRWQDRDGNTWHWNGTSWFKTVHPQTPACVEKAHPDPLYYAPWRLV